MLILAWQDAAMAAGPVAADAGVAAAAAGAARAVSPRERRLAGAPLAADPGGFREWTLPRACGALAAGQDTRQPRATDKLANTTRTVAAGGDGLGMHPGRDPV